MRIIHVTLEIRPDRTELYERTVQDLRTKVRQHEPGCVLLELCKDPAKANVYHVFEAYADENAIATHTATDYYEETANVFIECIAGDHMHEIRERGLTGKEMYSVVKNIVFERYDTV